MILSYRLLAFFGKNVSDSIQTAITKWHSWVTDKQPTFISHSFVGWKSKIRVPAWSGEDFSLCPYTAERASFYKCMNLIQEGSTLWPNHLPKVPIYWHHHSGHQDYNIWILEGYTHSDNRTQQLIKYLTVFKSSLYM